MGSAPADTQDHARRSREELAAPEQLSSHRVRSRLIFLLALVVVVVVVVTLLPGLGTLRSRLSHAKPEWLLLGVGLKLLSGVGYVAVFRGSSAGG